ncbi:hypothetical protein [Burkholderia multivorans]|uniref:hypothetical protein n=1 Tax=Burkholderia multivorans TaxID=87883 RepID=UPI003211DFC7
MLADERLRHDLLHRDDDGLARAREQHVTVLGQQPMRGEDHVALFIGGDGVDHDDIRFGGGAAPASAAGDGARERT